MRKYISLLLSVTLCASALGISHSVFALDNPKSEQPKKLATLAYVKQVRAPEVWKEKDLKGHPIKGKGIKIAVIDSGFDEKHPDFMGVTWSGYDYLRRKNTLLDTMGHGTHVAGICKRVAPEASFLFYRVLDTVPQILGLNICEAMEQAIKDGADVINLSVIYAGTKMTDLFKRVLAKAATKGIVVVVGVGNNGPQKGNMFSILANATNVITVGACTREIPIPTLQLKGESRVVETVPTTICPDFPAIGTFPLLQVSKSTNLNQAKGKILLIKRSESLDGDFLVRAKRCGAIGVIGFNNAMGEWYGEENVIVMSEKEKKLLKAAAPFVTVSGRVGNYLQQQITKGNNRVTLGTVIRERMTCFSTSGPGLISYKNPDVVAPGQDIYSSFPMKLSKTGHKVHSGTSMATPVVSGAVALLKQGHPEWTPGQFKAALSNNAMTLMTSEGARAPYLSQGAGRIDVFKAMHTDTLLTPNQLRFGNLKMSEVKKNNTIERTLYLQNASNEEKMYQLNVELVTGKNHLQLQTPTSVTVKAKSKKSIPLSLKTLSNIPKGVYTGSVQVKCGKQEWKVPYSFFVGWDPKSSPFYGLI